MIFKAMNLEKEIPRCTTVDIQTQTNIPELRFNKINVIQQNEMNKWNCDAVRYRRGVGFCSDYPSTVTWFTNQYSGICV